MCCASARADTGADLLPGVIIGGTKEVRFIQRLDVAVVVPDPHWPTKRPCAVPVTNLWQS